MAKEKKTKEELTNLFLVYQSNMFPSLVTMLAKELDVSEESINRLGVGFDYLKQAWVFAERNERGQIVGLSFRLVAGGKYMVSGSQRGLTYECIGEIKKGENPYRGSGFVPCRIAGVDCPMCGAEGRRWCMVSRDDPHNPSACICGRTEQDSVKYIQGCGYLHKLRNDAEQAQRILSPLSSSDKPHPVVEGASDVLAAMDSGLVPVGKPSAEGGEPYLARLLRDRDVVVMGEHDSGVGIRGMERSARQLLTSAANVRTLMPPTGYKDFRAWSPSVEGFTAECSANAKNLTTEVGEKKLYIDTTWEEKANIVLDTRYNSPKRSHLIFYDDGWWYHDSRRYKALNNNNAVGKQVISCFSDYIQERYVMGRLIWRKANVDKKFRSEIYGHLKCMMEKERMEGQKEPFYLDSGMGADVARSVMFRNGMLDVITGRLIPFTPKLFFRSTIPYNYDSQATCDEWLTVLDQIFAGNEDAIALVQEWFGYNLTISNELEQFMFFYGVPRSGKGTICTMLHAMMGPERCVSPHIDTLGSYTFGSEALLDKYVIQLNEPQNLKPTQRDKLFSFLKRLTGNDTDSVDRKNKLAIQHRMFGKILVVCNGLFSFVDECLSMKDRINLVKFNRSFAAHPDISLKTRLPNEVQGVAAWAVKGLQRLLENEQFTRPAESERIINSMLEESSPIRTMLKEHCVISDDWTKFTLRTTLHQFYKALSVSEGTMYPCGAKLFRQRLAEAWPEMSKHEGQAVGMGRVYRGLVIKPKSMLLYLSGE